MTFVCVTHTPLVPPVWPCRPTGPDMSITHHKDKGDKRPRKGRRHDPRA
jgi:hypothetical protein